MLKQIISSSIILLGIFYAEATLAITPAPRKLELEYLQAAITYMHGEPTSQQLVKLEQLYDQDHQQIKSLLSSGYLMCELFGFLAESGFERKKVLDESIEEMTALANSLSRDNDQPIEKEQLRAVQTMVTTYLCPEYY